jgi:hypothetical protein
MRRFFECMYVRFRHISFAGAHPRNLSRDIRREAMCRPAMSTLPATAHASATRTN